MALRGVFSRPFIDLEPLVDCACFPELHAELCLGLAQLPLDYTGGSHRSMGIMPPGREDEALVDYQEVIRALPADEFEVFRGLADRPEQIDGARRGELEFGEERAIPLSRRQMAWLKIRHGVYFPWKGYLELIPNQRWEDKADPTGKRFTRVAEAYFPKTLAFVRSLPFLHVGRCNIMGLEGNDWGTLHRDGDPAEQEAPDQFITFCPGGDKVLYLWDVEAEEATDVPARVYWFNDFDYHGVRVAPRFRYSIRVDGAFAPEFLARVERLAAGEGGA